MRLVPALLLVWSCSSPQPVPEAHVDPDSAASASAAGESPPDSTAPAAGWISYSDETAQAEAGRLAASGGRAAREGAVLKLSLAGGRFFRLADRDIESEEFLRFAYLDYIGEIGFYLVAEGHYEGGQYLVVNAATGRQFPLDALPVLSPDHERLATANMDLEAGYTPTRLQVFRVSADSLVLEITVGPADSENWGPSHLEWVDPALIRFRKNTPDYTSDVEYASTAAVLRRTGDGWEVRDGEP